MADDREPLHREHRGAPSLGRLSHQTSVALHQITVALHQASVTSTKPQLAC